MKKSLITLLFFFLVKISFAQTAPAIIDSNAIPAFSITKLPDSTDYTQADLKKKKATIIMIFSPDCEHCQRETDSLIAHIDLFKDAQILMVSPLDYTIILKFYNDYHIANYHNITMARDHTYTLGLFYKVHSYPSIHVYDKNGLFKKTFEGSYPVQKIADAMYP